jgi:hypothetical protein
MSTFQIKPYHEKIHGNISEIINDSSYKNSDKKNLMSLPQNTVIFL